MAGLKYDKYIKKSPVGPKRHVEQTADIMNLRGGHDWGGIPLNIRFEVIDNPFMMITDPHTHTFDQFLGFLGGNVMDALDFTGEVEFYMGEEMEKHVITETCIIHIPPGLVHGPLNFKKIDRPIRFYDIALTAEYKRTNFTK